MKPEWRLLCDNIHEARHHFAMEEALARLVNDGKSPPTFRMRRVNPAVFVGVFQNTSSEVDIEYCKSHNIQIVRRSNGGGAVYHEMGSFCFSAFFHRDLFPQNEMELYRLFATPAIATCAYYGVDAHFSGRNDVVVGERKIYGSAQFALYDAFVQSGTFLVNMDFDVMARALTPPAIKFTGKSVDTIKERVTSLSREVGRVLDTPEVMDRFIRFASEKLGLNLVKGELTSEEQSLALELLAQKYGTDEWNFGSKPEYRLTVAERIEEGVISLSVNVVEDKIQKARISGDLLMSDSDSLRNLEDSLAACSFQKAQAVVKSAPIPVGISESLVRLLEKLAHESSEISSVKTKEDSPWKK